MDKIKYHLCRGENNFFKIYTIKDLEQGKFLKDLPDGQYDVLERFWFTGLKDSAGNELYVNDVIKKASSTGIIRQGSDCFMIDWFENPNNWNDILYIHAEHSKLLGTYGDTVFQNLML